MQFIWKLGDGPPHKRAMSKNNQQETTITQVKKQNTEWENTSQPAIHLTEH